MKLHRTILLKSLEKLTKKKKQNFSFNSFLFYFLSCSTIPPIHLDKWLFLIYAQNFPNMREEDFLTNSVENKFDYKVIMLITFIIIVNFLRPPPF